VTRAVRVLAVALGLATTGMAAIPRVARGQDPRLAARLDAPTRGAVLAIMDTARAARLPTQPLADKALEGARKGADGPRIVTAVRMLAVEMRESRSALGRTSAPDEIIAGANALHAGVPPAELARLRAAGGRRPVALALAVASDLVARRVPVLVASGIVVDLVRSGARDADLTAFQRNVRLDIEHGADPTAAATTRARGAMLHASGTPAAPRPH